MGIGSKFISIFGDTLSGTVKKKDALDAFKKLSNYFNYKVDETFMASEVVCDENLLKDGSGKYSGTKIFEAGDEKIVGVKSDGTTSCFYQDVALATELNATTLYITGVEQNEHFLSLKKLFPHIEHIGLDLVTAEGKKMGSRYDNVRYASDVIGFLLSEFNNDIQLAYNVFAGQTLKSAPSVTKKINLDTIHNVKASQGLYLSYTMARMKSAGVMADKIEKFNSNELNYHFLNASWNLSPNLFFDAMIEHCKKINNFYEKYQIKDNPENQTMFSNLYEDLLYGAGKLGFFKIDKV
jgi:arginyl-tRNA synthetase